MAAMSLRFWDNLKAIRSQTCHDIDKNELSHATLIAFLRECLIFTPLRLPLTRVALTPAPQS